MNKGISPVGPRVTVQNTVFKGNKAKQAIKAVSSIDKAYAEELKEIQQHKKDLESGAVIYLNPGMAMEKAKDAIRVFIDTAKGVVKGKK